MSGSVIASLNDPHQNFFPRVMAKTAAEISTSKYDAGQIQVLKGLEAVRKRPGMYIGSTSSRGLHHLVYEVVDNSIDEALAGHATKIDVTIHPDDSITVIDDGRGIPVDIHPTEKIPGVELAMTVLHAGGKFDKNSYKVSGGLHGVGVSVVNALAEQLKVWVRRGGKEYYMDFERGNTVTKLKTLPKADAKARGTTVWFKPDPKIFTELSFDYDLLANRLRELSYLNKGITITIKDEREGKEKTEVFHAKGGLKEMVQFLNDKKKVLHQEIVYIDTEREGIEIELAFQYNDGYNENVFSFVNNINTHEGGTHLTGLKAALTRTINNYAAKSGALKKADFTLSGDDVREGLTAVLSVKVREPQFEGQTKTKLGNSEVEGAVKGVVNEQLAAYLEEHPRVANIVIEKAVSAARAREAARKARDLTRKKSALDIDNARYHKLILMTDADVDGAHIRTLLLTFFYRQMPQLIEAGFVYIAQPPLYRVAKGKEEFYAYDEKEREDYVKRLANGEGKSTVNIQRYKGLGEMNPLQLWHTTMDPETRTILQVTIEDAILANDTFARLMRDDVEPRRLFIEENAKFVSNLDI